MIKKFNLFFLLVTLLCVACSKSPSEQLKDAVKVVNKECPVSLGMTGEMVSVTYENDIVVMSYDINEDMIDIETYKQNQALMEQNLSSMIQQAKGDQKKLFDLINDAGAGVTICFNGRTSGKSVEISLTNEQLKNLDSSSAQAEEVSPEEALQSQVELTNTQMPMQPDVATTMNRVVIEEKYVVYEATVDEEYITIDDLRTKSEEMKKGIYQGYVANETVMRYFFDCCINTHRGIAYRYTGSKTGEQMEIHLDIDELP